MADKKTPSPSNPQGKKQDGQAEDYDGPDRRDTVVDRRTDGKSFERRRGAGIRRPEFNKAAEEGEMNQEQFLFIKAIDAFKRANDRPYPTWTEVLEVIRKLGYRKTAAMDVDLPGLEDWSETADAPAFPAADADTPDEDQLDAA